MIKLGDDCELNIEKLIATRMLINANSGGGKSWLLRRLLEQSQGKVQQIIIDLEGEFVTLREKYDYLLVGESGEIPVNIKTAELLAKKLLGLNVSTIIDLSELKHSERITFVKRFLDSLVNSPKNLWHPVMIVIDEAHQFCPEKSKSESGSAVIDLMTRGRKRGFCGILSTQRISKLHKDACAEANNYMTGRTFLDIDQKRAGEILGFTDKNDVRGLRNLGEGEFHCLGPAFVNQEVTKTKVGEINTTHPDRTKGTNILKPSETPDNIKKILKDIVDLPKEAEEELKTVQDMKQKIRELKLKLRSCEHHKQKPEVDEKALQLAKDRAYKEGLNQSIDEKNKILHAYKQTEKKLTDIGKIISKEVPILNTNSIKSTPHINTSIPKPLIKETIPITDVNNGKLRAGAMKMLNWLAGVYPSSLTKQRLATLSGFSIKGGTFNTYISELKREGWIVGSNDISITEDGINNADPQEMPSGEELLQLWKGKFRAGVGKILQFLYEYHPNPISKEEIGENVGFEPGGGTFNTYLSELKRNGLINMEDTNILISQEFFE